MFVIRKHLQQTNIEQQTRLTLQLIYVCYVIIKTAYMFTNKNTRNSAHAKRTAQPLQKY